MNRLGRKAAALVAAAGAALLLALPASATAPTTGRGTFTDTNLTAPPMTRTADGNTFVTEHGAGVDNGTITGKRTFVITVEIHPDNTLNFRGVETCVCTVAGRAGTFVDRFDGTGVGLSFEGRFTVISGTGGLSDLHAVATFTGVVNPRTGLAAGRYTVEYHFDS